MRAGAVAVAVIVAGMALIGPAQAQQAVGGPFFLSPMGEPFRGDHVTPPIRTWFNAADQDGDGRISRAEFVAQPLNFFLTTFDANRDGTVTSLESSAIWREQAPELAAARPPPARARSPRQPSSGTPDPRAPRASRNSVEPDPPAMMAHFALFDIVEPVMSCDTDLSRRVTQAEYEACALRRFALLDTDADGYFALEDSPRAMALLEIGTPARD